MGHAAKESIREFGPSPLSANRHLACRHGRVAVWRGGKLALATSLGLPGHLRHRQRGVSPMAFQTRSRLAGGTAGVLCPARSADMGQTLPVFVYGFVAGLALADGTRCAGVATFPNAPPAQHPKRLHAGWGG